MPLLKKADLDPADAKSYRLISNLSITSKLLESIVSKQLVKYLKDNDLLPDVQSAYSANHSMEMAILKVLADILLALDFGDLVMLTRLEHSAAFNSMSVFRGPAHHRLRFCMYHKGRSSGLSYFFYTPAIW